MINLGKAVHRKTSRRCIVNMVNAAKNECFVYWETGPRHGDYVPAGELRNVGGRGQNPPAFRGAIHPDFTSGKAKR